jgi:hypothetical protein
MISASHDKNPNFDKHDCELHKIQDLSNVEIYLRKRFRQHSSKDKMKHV